MGPLLIPAISTGISLKSAFSGKNKQAREQRRYNNWLNNQQRKLDNWYRKENNIDFIDTASGQSQYNGLKRMLKENNERVDNTLVKTGATTESQLAAKEQAHNTLAEATNQMAAQDTHRKQYLSNTYMSQNNVLRGLRGDNYRAAIDGGANTADNGMSSLGNGLSSLFDSLSTLKKSQAKTS